MLYERCGEVQDCLHPHKAMIKGVFDCPSMSPHTSEGKYIFHTQIQSNVFTIGLKALKMWIMSSEGPSLVS